MPHKKQKKLRKINASTLAVMIALSLIIILVTSVGVKEKINTFSTEKALDQTFVDISRLYGDFITITPESEDLIYTPLNTCDYKNGKSTGYTCKTEGFVRYAGDREKFKEYYSYIDTILDPKIFSVDKRAPYTEYEGSLSRSYEMKHVKSQTNCRIKGSQDNGKIRFQFTCTKDSDNHVYVNQDDRKAERFYSD